MLLNRNWLVNAREVLAVAKNLALRTGILANRAAKGNLTLRSEL